MAYPRKYPCVDCRRPNTANRAGVRCADCAPRHGRKMRQQREQGYRDAGKVRVRPHVVRVVVPVLPTPSVDLDILAYRAHKERQAPFDAQAIESARRLLDTEMARFAPKRGRPRKDAERAA